MELTATRAPCVVSSCVDFVGDPSDSVDFHHAMKSLLLAVLFSLIFGGCSHQVFPSEALEGVEHNFDFAHWRMVPSQVEPTRIQLGGRILETQTIGETITM